MHEFAKITLRKIYFTSFLCDNMLLQDLKNRSALLIWFPSVSAGNEANEVKG